MVINGGSRSTSATYAAWLGAHLTRTDSNERVFLRRLDGVAADDLAAALLEMSAIASGARSKRGLYHANIDWRHDEHLSDAQKDRAVHRLAEELGLAGQPCVVVEHVKDGREHLHAVWMRIDIETGRAISDSHNYRRHEIVARDLEREFDLARVQGVHVEREGIERPARTPESYEFAQAARTGLTPAEAKAEITTLWNQADSGRAFADALDDAGWTLARGDKRDFVVIDRHGEAHSLGRRVDGVKAAQVRARMADIEPARLPSVDQARQAVRDRQAGPEAQPEPVFAVPEPAFSAELPPDLDARFGPSPEIDPDAGLVPDPVPEQLHQVDGLDAHRQAFADRQQARADLENEDTPQHRQARPRQVQEPKPEALRRQESTQGPQRSAHDNDARRAMEDLARTDPLGMAARHGFHAGDRLKTPEDMRREMAERMRSFAVSEPDARVADAPKLGGTDLPAPSPEATQRPSYEVEQQGKGRPMGFLGRLWARICAFGAAGMSLDPTPEPEPVTMPRAHPLDLGGGAGARAPESGPVNARMAADLRPEPKPASVIDDDKAREIARQIEAGRKAEVYDKGRMRDLAKAHHELKGAAPDIAPAPRRSPLDAMLERVRAAEDAAPAPTPKRGGGRSIEDDDTHGTGPLGGRRYHHQALWHLLTPFAPPFRPGGGVRPGEG